MFKNIGRIGIEMYLLFQHHTTLEILRNVSTDIDLFTITGTGWHFVKFLGPAVAVVGPDTRSERNPHQVMAGPTYQGLFPKVAMLPPSVQHCIWMVPVPLIYPRLEQAEQLANTMATGKKAVTGTFNALSRVTSGVAGIVGAKGVVGEGFNSVKKAVGKSGLMSGILSPFGEIDILDELRDQWTHESKDLERTYLVRTLQGISHNKSMRMTFFSGDVNCCGAGLVHDPSHPSDHKTMYQIISSSVVNAPPSGYVLRMLHNNKPLYIPANGHRSTNSPSDTKEDMMEIFTQDVNGQPREMRRLMGRRNYVACVAYDPEIVSGSFGATVGGGSGMGMGGGKLSLAVDFMVQGEGVYGVPMKYGPVIIPSLEYGRLGPRYGYELQSPSLGTARESRRAFSSSPVRMRDHHFDTLKFVQRLKDEGFTEEQAVAMMKVLSDVIEESPAPFYSIQNLTRTMVLREDQDRTTYTQKVDFAKLRSELLSADSTETSATRTSHERLTNELQKLNSRLRDEVERTKASVRLDLNLEKGRIREEAGMQEMKVKETETRIEQESAGLRERLESVKFQSVQWLL
ncbi:MAG: hypothetical protein Q9165_001706 [Trypethelium subeluteriae]